MNIKSSTAKDLYYTTDHEWIDFRGAIAYTGICAFKLTGFREIQAIHFHTTPGLAQKGELIATVRYNDYEVEARMPVDGKILQMNEDLVSGRYESLLQSPQAQGWIALIAPARPYDRKDLLLPTEYQMNGKTKYDK
ncbi:MAG TPA: hypothetical protein PKC69_06735 [Chitinophagaceae bacterium]|nr:hypothetical protein [Chitinophagaceae bacterium]